MVQILNALLKKIEIYNALLPTVGTILYSSSLELTCITKGIELIKGIEVDYSNLQGRIEGKLEELLFNILLQRLR